MKETDTPRRSPGMRFNSSRVQTVLIVFLVASVSFVLGSRYEAIAGVVKGSQGPDNLDLSSVQVLYDELRDNYDGKLDTQKLIDGAKHGMTDAAGDPYTVYFNASESKEFDSDLEGTFDGIGAELGKRDKRLIIVSTLDGSPARAAGVLPNDTIVRVNGQDASQWAIDKAVKEIRGPKGTTVKLTVVRGEQSELKEFSITRDHITNPSVKSEVQGDIGYMRISRFGEDTTELAQQGAKQFKDAGVKGIVLDLRGNGGGYLTAAQGVSSIWMKNKVVMTQRTDGKITDTLKTTGDPILEGVPTVVLVDGGSASASEIVAGALSDNKAAQLVGEKTFGKGSVQTVQKLPDGGELKVTIAKWYTPNGKNITKEGIEPTTKVSLTADDITAGRDPQKDKAFELLR